MLSLKQFLINVASSISTLMSTKVDMTTPLLNFDDTAVDPTTDDGALANALRALDILDEVIPTGGGMLYLKKVLMELANIQHTQFKIATVSLNGTALPAQALFDLSVNIPVPSGYYPIGMRGYSFSRISGLDIAKINVTSSAVSVGGYNNSNSTTLNGTIYVLCAKNGING